MYCIIWRCVVSLLICDSRYVTQGNIRDNELREETFCRTVAKKNSTKRDCLLRLRIVIPIEKGRDLYDMSCLFFQFQGVFMHKVDRVLLAFLQSYNSDEGTVTVVL